MRILYLEDNNDIEELIEALNNLHPSDFNSTFSLDTKVDHVIFPIDKFISFFGCPRCLDTIDLGFLKLSTSTNEVSINGCPTCLSKKEHDILVYLISHSPRIISKDTLFLQVWNTYDGVNSNTVEVHINRLRSKIGKRHIICVKGFGYKFVSD